jgi:hypothetical protein
MSSSSAPSKPAAAPADSVAATSKRSAEARVDDAKRHVGDGGDFPKFDIQDNNGRVLASFYGERQAYDALLRYRVVERGAPAVMPCDNGRAQAPGITVLPEHLPTCVYEAYCGDRAPCHECARLTDVHMEAAKLVQRTVAVYAAPKVDRDTGDSRGSKGWHDKHCKWRMQRIEGLRHGSDSNYECPVCGCRCE